VFYVLLDVTNRILGLYFPTMRRIAFLVLAGILLTLSGAGRAEPLPNTITDQEFWGLVNAL